MKMFLTRLGPGSRGGHHRRRDPGRPFRAPGGLRAVKRIQPILAEVADVEFVYLEREDVVRHRLVRDIILAFERHAEEESSKRPGGSPAQVNSAALASLERDSRPTRGVIVDLLKWLFRHSDSEPRAFRRRLEEKPLPHSAEIALRVLLLAGILVLVQVLFPVSRRRDVDLGPGGRDLAARGDRSVQLPDSPRPGRARARAGGSGARGAAGPGSSIARSGRSRCARSPPPGSGSSTDAPPLCGRTGAVAPRLERALGMIFTPESFGFSRARTGGRSSMRASGLPDQACMARPIVTPDEAASLTTDVVGPSIERDRFHVRVPATDSTIARRSAVAWARGSRIPQPARSDPGASGTDAGRGPAERFATRRRPRSGSRARRDPWCRAVRRPGKEGREDHRRARDRDPPSTSGRWSRWAWNAREAGGEPAEPGALARSWAPHADSLPDPRLCRVLSA